MTVIAASVEATRLAALTLAPAKKSRNLSVMTNIPYIESLWNKSMSQIFAILILQSKVTGTLKVQYNQYLKVRKAEFQSESL